MNDLSVPPKIYVFVAFLQERSTFSRKCHHILFLKIVRSKMRSVKNYYLHLIHKYIKSVERLFNVAAHNYSVSAF